MAYNMHWMAHSFALPQLPKGMEWHLLADTGKGGKIEMAENPEEEQQHVDVAPRTIRIYCSKQIEGAECCNRNQYVRSAF